MAGCGSLECVAEATEEDKAAEQMVEAETAEEAVAAGAAVGGKAAVAKAAETVAAEMAVGRQVGQMGEETRERGGVERVKWVVVRAPAAVAR